MHHPGIFVAIGSYTHGGDVLPTACGVGITLAQLDPVTGQLTHLSDYSEVANPSWLCASEDGRHLFAVSEMIAHAGQVHSFTLANDGELIPLSSQSSHGLATCHLTATANYLFAASYLDGRLTVYPLKSGVIGTRRYEFAYQCSGPNLERQERSHAHHALVGPNGRWLYVCDLGGDRIHRHDLTQVGFPALGAIMLPPGVGPRHMVFHPHLPVAYLFCELKPHVIAFNWNAKSGNLTTRQTYDLESKVGLGPVGAGASIHIHPSAQLLGVSERAASSICLFKVDADGTISFSQQVAANGQRPRDFRFSPDGRWLLIAYQETHSITVHRINADLEAESAITCELPVKSPVCVCCIEQ